MKKFEFLICCLIVVLILPCMAQITKAPPSSEKIYFTIEGFWQKKEYIKVETYINELKNKFIEYVPVQITQIIELNKFGGQVESAIENIDQLMDLLKLNEMITSPIFNELLIARKNRYASLANYYQHSNITIKYRAENENPLLKTKFKPSKRWGDELLYFNAPEICISSNGVNEVETNDNFTLPKKYLKLSEKEILQKVNVGECDILTKKHFIRELVKRRSESEDVGELLKGLTEGSMVYTYGETVRVMEKNGEKYVGPVLDLLNDPSGIVNKLCVMWALVRMKTTDDRIFVVLVRIANDEKSKKVERDYAEKVIDFLKEVKMQKKSERETDGDK